MFFFRYLDLTGLVGVHFYCRQRGWSYVIHDSSIKTRTSKSTHNFECGAIALIKCHTRSSREYNTYTHTNHRYIFYITHGICTYFHIIIYVIKSAYALCETMMDVNFDKLKTIRYFNFNGLQCKY